MKVSIRAEREDTFVLLLVTRTNEETGNSQSEGIRIPYDLIEDAIQTLTDEQRHHDDASFATETVIDKGFGIGPLCEEDPEFDGMCAYHGLRH